MRGVDDGEGGWVAGENFVWDDAYEGAVLVVESAVGDVEVAFVGVVDCGC